MLLGTDDEPPGRPAGRTWAAGAVGLLLLVAWLTGHGGAVGGRAVAPAPSVAGGAAQAAVAGAAGPATDHPPWVYPAYPPLPSARPLLLDIASIGVHADLVGRGLRAGTVEPPPYDTPGVAGWYRAGPAPGAPGAALVVGHVDTPTQPAVFYRLGTVRRGARADVTRADGTVAEFSVEAVETVPKDRFDPARVYGYGSLRRPELRLITCGGAFDPAAGAYAANLVVYAVLTGEHRV